jgi:hypothetical protein
MGRKVANWQPVWYMVEAIRSADNARVIFGTFSSERAAEHFAGTAQHRHPGWEFTTQVGSPQGTLPQLRDIALPMGRKAS